MTLDEITRDGRKYRPRILGEEEEHSKCEPFRFSAVNGRPGSDEPGWPITALNQVADISACNTLPPLVISLAGTLYSTQTLSLYH